MSSRLVQVLPPSLHTKNILAAAEAAGLQEVLSLDQIPLVNIWSRLGELTVDQLDHMAWHLHIDGYSYCESKKEKLWLIENFHNWHRYKGTIYGHRLYWRKLLNREIYGYAPRFNSFLGSSLTVTERAMFEKPHPEVRVYPFSPEVRVYPFRDKSTVKGTFLNCIKSPGFTVKDDSEDRVGSQIYCYDPATNEETKLNRVDGGANTPIAMSGKAAGFFFNAAGPTFTCNHGAANRLYDIELVPSGSESFPRPSLAVRPLTPMKSNFEAVGVTGQAKGVFPGNRYTDVYENKSCTFFGGFMTGQKAIRKIFFINSEAGDRIYKKLKLFDPERALKSTRVATSFLGCFRLGKMKAHHGEIAVDCTGSAPVSAFFLGAGVPGAHVPFTSDVKARLSAIFEVGKLAARASDKIAISITNHSVVKCSSAYVSGQVLAGQYKLKAVI